MHWWKLSSPSDRGVDEERCYAGLHCHQKRGVAEKAKHKGSLGCSGHEMVEFCIQKAGKSEHITTSLPWTLRADFSLFRDLFGSRPLDKALRGRGAQESWHPCMYDQCLYIPFRMYPPFLNCYFHFPIPILHFSVWRLSGVIQLCLKNN